MNLTPVLKVREMMEKKDKVGMGAHHLLKKKKDLVKKNKKNNTTHTKKDTLKVQTRAMVILI